MSRKIVITLIGLMLLIILSACGQKSKEAITEKLTKQIEQMKSYEVKAKMSIKTGTDTQVYDIDIWHQKPHYYRVHLKNTEQDQSQMIIRNDEDVFVLTPALNKSFRFQSDWPQNSSQAYLYESLVEDIKNDNAAIFTETKEHYIFETKTTYQNNKMLPIQEITFAKKSLAPVSVKVMDPDRKQLVKVDFSNFKLNVQFKKEDFDLKKNMTGARLQLQQSTEPVSADFAVKYPTADLQGVSLVEEKELATDTGRRVIQTYEGAGKSYTFIQEKAQVVTAMADVATATYIKGDPVDINTTIGAITDNSIMWTENGVDYFIVSNDLARDEFLMLASSVQASTVVK